MVLREGASALTVKTLRTGVAVIEVPYVKDMLDHCEFDTIYHEHLSYFSLTALDRCFRRHGLVIADVERVPIHGGSLRLSAIPLECVNGVPPRVSALLAEEMAWGVDTEEPYLAFAVKVNQLRAALRMLLGNLKAAGLKLAAYGASAKGNTLLNHCGIREDLLEFTVDRSPHKQGLFLPGTHIPIHAPERIAAERPDFVLVLPWNLRTELTEQLSYVREWGGRRVFPIPTLEVV